MVVVLHFDTDIPNRSEVHVYYLSIYLFICRTTKLFVLVSFIPSSASAHLPFCVPPTFVMFKRFSVDESVSAQSAMKSSQQRAARTKIVDQMPPIEPYIEHFFPKKDKTIMAKCTGHISILATSSGTPLFFQIRNGDFVPTLRTLHKYPFLLPIFRVDRGAIKHVINGAHIMVPGLRSQRAELEGEVDSGSVVAIYAESKQHALAVGIAQMSTAEIRSTDKGVAVETLHHVSDDLWKCTSLS